MNNGFGGKQKYGFRKWNARTTKYLAIGMQDFLAGAKFPLEYDTWAKLDQANYENGRLQAANITQAGLKPIIPTTAPTYQKYRTRRKEAAKLIGDASPGWIHT